METTYNKVINFIEKHHMIEADSLVAVGVSGGADSVCLLHILRRLSDKIPFRILAVHVDHGVRAESAEDAAYVERLCQELAIPFYLQKVDMNGYAEEQGLSSEEAGRQLRYAAFEEVLRQQQSAKVCKIAVAHNANDRAETMLFHLFRGSGMKGLSSIQPVRGSVIRPLLCLERAEIERYLAEQNLTFCQDSTNEEDKYTRNKIRHHILPYAEKEICSGAVIHMGELADIVSETERYLANQTKRLYEACVEEKEGCLSIQCGRLLAEDPAMYKRVLLSCMERLTPHRKDVTGQHISDLVNLMTKQGSKELSLPYGIKAYKEYERLLLCQSADGNMNRTDESGAADQAYVIKPPVEIVVPGEGTYAFTLHESNGSFWEKQENRYTKWLDYDKITTDLLLRTRRRGDYLTIDAALHTQSVKQYMINEKIPKIRRDNMHVLADGAHVLWIPGYRISQRCKVDESTKRILQVQLRGGNHGGAD